MGISRFGLAALVAQSVATICACGSSGTSDGRQDGGIDLSNGANGSSSGGPGETPAVACGGQACAGCCDTALACQPGNTNTVCGASGAACEDCAQAGGTCMAGGCAGTSSSYGSSSGGRSSSGSSGGTPVVPVFDGGLFPVFDAGLFPVIDAGGPRGGRDAGHVDVDAGGPGPDSGGAADAGSTSTDASDAGDAQP